MSCKNVTIVDYGLGNLFSIRNAIESLDGSVEFSSDPDCIARADRVVLPGVGAFAEGMQGLQAHGLHAALGEFVQTGKPLIGICLGMQLLSTESEEHGRHAGLDFVPGRVVRFSAPVDGQPGFKIPHIGWNRVTRNSEFSPAESCLTHCPDDFFMYFVHSFYVIPDQTAHCLASTDYGRNQFCSAVQKDNIVGFQGHPERSGEVGQLILQNFLQM